MTFSNIFHGKLQQQACITFLAPQGWTSSIGNIFLSSTTKQYSTCLSLGVYHILIIRTLILQSDQSCSPIWPSSPWFPAWYWQMTVMIPSCSVIPSLTTSIILYSCLCSTHSFIATGKILEHYVVDFIFIVNTSLQMEPCLVILSHFNV